MESTPEWATFEKEVLNVEKEKQTGPLCTDPRMRIDSLFEGEFMSTLKDMKPVPKSVFKKQGEDDLIGEDDDDDDDPDNLIEKELDEEDIEKYFEEVSKNDDQLGSTSKGNLLQAFDGFNNNRYKSIDYDDDDDDV